MHTFWILGIVVCCFSALGAVLFDQPAAAEGLAAGAIFFFVAALRGQGQEE